MATVAEHYDEVLSDVYSWMFGGFEIAIQRNVEFMDKHNLSPNGSGIAIDLGAGCGFQSIPLARAGYAVTAVDIVYRKMAGEWRLFKNFYRKLRLSKGWVDKALSNLRFTEIDSKIEKGFVTIIAVK